MFLACYPLFNLNIAVFGVIVKAKYLSNSIDYCRCINAYQNYYIVLGLILISENRKN